MTPQTQQIAKQNSPEPMERARQDLDRTLRWCCILFVGSSLTLIALAWYAVETGNARTYIRMAGIAYTLLCSLFLGIIAYVFILGHVGSSREIEAPKMELFELEDRK